MSLVFSNNVQHRIGAISSSRNIFTSALVALIAFGFSSAVFARQPQPLPSAATSDMVPTAALAGVQKPDQHVLIQLTEQPAVAAFAGSLPSSGGSRPNEIAVAAGQNQIAINKTQQAALINAMQAAGIQYKEIYRVQRAMNGLAVIVPAAQIDAIRQLSGVKAVREIIPAVPTSNSSASFVGANQVWQGLPAALADGTGMRIGIIDTGIDYQHSNFGGTGLLADYQANNRVSAGGLFPTAKVVGGTDLAGDNYNASGSGAALTPVPDANPTDCNGHGSHVAGIAAGFGVTSGGATFSGPYDTPTLQTLRIQPGIALKALLYAIRVFGCGGSTDLVVQAIDYALDPNGDGDLSDHLDVINMSLGSNVGSLSSLDAEASEAASLSGMVVVAAAGNAGDTYMIVSAPSVSRRTISVAASWDGGETAGKLLVSAPAPVAGSYFAVPAAFGPAIPGGPGLSGNLVYALNGTLHNGCAAFTNAAAIAGNIAVIDRGTCSFQTKANYAQLAGATGVVVVDNVIEVPLTMAGDATVPAITIPSVMISKTDGVAIEAQLLAAATVTGNLGGVSGGDLVASFSSRGPDNGMPIGMKPDITAPGLNIVSAQSGMTCVTGGGCITPTASGYDPDNASLSISGTSMATPQVAGLMALLRQLHPTLSVEELKALAMNGSIHDLTTAPGGTGFRYGAGRVGAGRIDAVASANLSAAAFNADGSGTVGVTFPGEVGASTTVTRKVRVKNYGATPTTFTLGIDTVVDNPGVSFSLPGGSSLTLLGNQTVDIDVRMSGSANLLTHTHDPTILSVQAGQPRFWLTEETAYLTLSAGGTLLRVPLYVAPYPASTMSAGAAVPTGGLPSGTATINLTGTGVCTGVFTPGPPPSCSGTFPNDELSLVSPFELQVSNPRNPAVPPENNLRYAGVSTDGSTLSFGLALWGPAGTPWSFFDADTEVTIVDSGGAPLFTLFPYYIASGGLPSNVYGTGVYKYATGSTSIYYFANGVSANGPDTRVFQNDVLFLTAPLSVMGISSTATIHYVVDTYNSAGGVDHVGPFPFNMGAQGLNFGGGGLLYDDLPGATIPVTFSVANLAANGSLGALMLHHHNKTGMTAEVLTVPTVTAYPLTVTVAGTGMGAVTSAPVGIGCPGTCASAFAAASSVTLSAVANAGSTFTGWSGACTGTGTCTVTMSSAMSVTATFALSTGKIGIFRYSLWALDYNGNGAWDGTPTDRLLSFGVPGDVPIVGDWNGDGRAKIGIFRNGVWALDYNGNGVWDGTPTDLLLSFGVPGDIPVVGDWNGDGRAKIGIFRNGLWGLDYNGNGVWDGSVTDRLYTFGVPGDTPVAGDWNGDGHAKIGIFRYGIWGLDYNGNGVWDGSVTDRLYSFGFPSDLPVVGDWNGDGHAKVGIFRNGLWALDYNGNGIWEGYPVDQSFTFGAAGDRPLAGRGW
jgi:subtilisin family serine protease